MPPWIKQEHFVAAVAASKSAEEVGLRPAFPPGPWSVETCGRVYASELRWNLGHVPSAQEVEAELARIRRKYPTSSHVATVEFEAAFRQACQENVT